MLRIRNFLVVLIAVLAFTARIIPGPRTIDDAYITFRYARNLAAGYGPVFNPGERVLGTTTPLYMGLLTLVSMPWVAESAPFPEISLVLNALADALTCVLLILIGYKIGFQTAGWGTAAAWAISPMSTTFAIGGLETSVYILLLAGLFYFRLAGRNRLVGVFGGLALLTRPDAVLFLALIALEECILLARHGIRPESLRRIGDILLPFLLFCTPWFLFAAAFYGTLLPHSIFAKALAYHLDPNAGLMRLIQHYATPYFEHTVFTTAIIAVTGPFYLFLSLLGITAVRKTQSAWIGLTFPWVYFSAFAIANPLIFRWYLVPPLPFYFLALYVGLDRLLGMSTPSVPKGKVRMALFSVVAIFWVGTYLLLGWTLHPDHGPSRPAPGLAWIRLELLYRQVAEDLRPGLKSDDRVAAGDVGTLGYFLDVNILDTVGLNSVEATGYYPLPDSMYAINYAIPPDLILQEQPTYLIILEAYGRNGLLRDDRFLQEYRTCLEYPTDIYGSRSLIVFCRDKQP